MSSTTPLRRLLSGVSLAALALLGACGGDSGSPLDPGPGTNPGPDSDTPEPMPGVEIQGRAIFGLTCANQLVLFGSGNPESLARQVQISGMPAGAAMLGIDFRPSGGLYGIGSDSRVYAIDTLTGAASAVGGAFAPAISGEHFGLTFGDDDTMSLSGVESNLSQAVSAGGASSPAIEMAYAAGDANAGTDPAVAAEGASAGTVYGIETNANAVVRVSPAGELTTIATLPFNVYICSGMDVGSDGTAYASLATNSGSELYQVDLGSGTVEFLGGIGGSSVHSLAVVE
jgi:hypothetical protein